MNRIETGEEQEREVNRQAIEKNTNSENYTIKKSKNLSNWSVFISFLIILIIGLIVFFVLNMKPNWKYIIFGELDIQSIAVNNYNIENNNTEITITTANTITNNEIKCYLSMNRSISNSDEYVISTNNKFKFNTELKDYYVILVNNNRILNTVKLTDYINKSVALKLSVSKIYLAVGAEKDIDVSITSIGKIQDDIIWRSSNSDVATVEDGKIIAVANGTADITASDLYGNSSVVSVTVTDLIDNYILKSDKPLLKGTIYSLEEANLLDEILFSRVNEAGNSTRAGAVAAARFLTLEFPYSIPYFFENGRLNSSGTAYVDGEGRYYHKGLYLHKSKFETIEASLVGPAIWGMPLTNFEDSGRYVSGVKMPNGLDCSGFVSWALLNGGFDPGDYGAGENSDIPNQMTDLGEFVKITDELLDSETVKSGDLINFWGHIGMIVGIDGEDYYVAETLDTFGKLVVKKYKKSRNLRPFTNIVLMDSYYKEPGNYTKMW